MCPGTQVTRKPRRRKKAKALSSRQRIQLRYRAKAKEKAAADKKKKKQMQKKKRDQKKRDKQAEAAARAGARAGARAAARAKAAKNAECWDVEYKSGPCSLCSNDARNLKFYLHCSSLSTLDPGADGKSRRYSMVPAVILPQNLSTGNGMIPGCSS